MKFTQRLLIPGSILLFAMIIVAGCGHHEGDDKQSHADEKDKKPHVHPTVGEHGGMIVEWGEEEYHPEYVRDAGKKEVTVYIYDGEVEELAPIEAAEIKLSLTSETPPLDVTLKAVAQKDDPKGKSSRFVGTHEKLGGDGKLKGVVRGEFGGKKYSGRFDEAKKEEK